MTSTLGCNFKAILASSALLLAGAGCTESFTAAGGSGGGTATATGGNGGGTTSAGGTTTTTPTTTAECVGDTTQPCYTGPKGTKGVGICAPGVNHCVNGKWGEACDGQVVPASETCDGHDNNCDGKTDEGCSCTNGATQNCSAGPGTPGVGICKWGTQTCAGGMWGECTGGVAKGMETCDNFGADDDCDNVLDNIANLDQACSTGKSGICAGGVNHCKNGVLTCVQSIDAVNETCANPGADDNCDGITDNISGIGTSCPLQNGMCSGLLTCVGNAQSCVPQVALFENFNNPQNWELSGEWEFGPATASGGQQFGNPDPDTDHSNTSDDKIAGIVIGGNAQNQIHEPYYLTSPVLNTSQIQGKVYLSFFRYLSSNPPSQMKSYIEVTPDDVTWSILWTNADPNGIADNAWMPFSYDVTPFKGQSFRVRFVQEIVQQGPLVSSWNLDDVAVASCPFIGN